LHVWFLDSRFRGNDLIIVMPAPRATRAGCGGHPVPWLHLYTRMKSALADQIFHELEVHSRLEQEVFYPAVEAKLAAEGKDLVADSLEAHHTVDTLIAEFRGLEAVDSQYHEKFDELRESVEEHIGEEEDELLPEALEALGDKIDRLSTQMQKRKEQLMASMQ